MQIKFDPKIITAAAALIIALGGAWAVVDTYAPWAWASEMEKMNKEQEKHRQLMASVFCPDAITELRRELSKQIVALEEIRENKKNGEQAPKNTILELRARIDRLEEQKKYVGRICAKWRE